MNQPQQKTDILRSMIQFSETDPNFGLMIGLMAVIVLLVLLFFLARLVTDFSAELRLLNIEINRSEGAEREHYLRQRRRLWLSLLPFVRY